MVSVNDTDKSDFAAVDSKGNLYEDDVEAEPYLFKPTGKTACYVPFCQPKSQSAGEVCIFHVTEEKAGLTERISNKVCRIADSLRSCTSGYLPATIMLIGFMYSASLALRTENNLSRYYIWTFVAVMIIICLFKENYTDKAVAVFCALHMLIYIPNYCFSRQAEPSRAVIEKINRKVLKNPAISGLGVLRQSGLPDITSSRRIVPVLPYGTSPFVSYLAGG